MSENTSNNWYREAYFDSVAEPSLDAMTSPLPPWHEAPARWGHSMHTMCSYHGMFPAKLVHYFIQRHSEPGDLVVDPFSGRGTTTLQARIEGRRSLGNDLNPLAHVLTAAKANPPTWSKMMGFIDQLEHSYNRAGQPEPDVSPDISMLFHKNTLRQILYLRSRILRTRISNWSPEELMLAGSMAGILHGAHRMDGSSAYLSVSMPNTFSMSPQYVRKYIRDHKLSRINQNVFDRLRDKVARLYQDAPGSHIGDATQIDAAAFLQGLPAETVDLIITSPPYLRVVNYGTSNWIRLWWLGLDEVARQQGRGRQHLDAALDHRHSYGEYRAFMLRTFLGVRRVLRQHGVAVFVIGDVAASSGTAMALAERVWADIGSQTELRLHEVIEDDLPLQSKVSRIWGETKGRATECDRIMVLTRRDSDLRHCATEIEWDEPYAEAGPDSAHARLKRRNQRR